MPGNHRAAAERSQTESPGKAWLRPGGANVQARHRLLESVALFAVPVFAVVMVVDVLARSESAWLLLLLAALVAHPVADLVSGLVHWAADRVLPASAPYLGPCFVRPFREHHSDPERIAGHDFIETNGNTCIALAPVMAFVWWWVDGQPRESPAALVEAFVLGLVFWLCITNQIHKWAHMTRPPVAVRWLQRSRVILEPGHHAIHHKMPFEERYCITSGWMNPLIDRSGLLGVLERCCRRAESFGSTGPGDGSR